MKNKQAKSIFSSLENFSSTPPPELWANIEAQLDKPKKKKRPIIWWWAAACLVAGLSLPTIWYVNSNQGNNQELIIGNDANGVVLQNNSKEDRNVNRNAGENESTNGKASADEKGNSTSEAKNDNLNSKETSISLTNANSAAVTTIPIVSSDVKKIKGFKKSNGKNNNQLIAEGSDKSQSAVIAVNKKVNVNSYNTASVVGFNNFS